MKENKTDGVLRAGANGDAALSFEPLRRHLTSIAYRMLGSVSEAEDTVQEAYLRWHAVDRTAVSDTRAFLTKTVTRLCLDYLKSARVRRESYVGTWLPEPLLDSAAYEAGSESEYADDLSVALMLALERLSPLERAAFLLHDVFDMSFAEVAETLGRNEAACRQLAARAREHVRAARPRFTVSQEEGARIADAFFQAAKGGDIGTLQQLLAEHAIIFSDGGGRKLAALNPIVGRDKVIRFFVGIARKAGYQKPSIIYRGLINGLPGFVTIEHGEVLQTTAINVQDGVITAIYIVRNPDKLKHVGGHSLH